LKEGRRQELATIIATIQFRKFDPFLPSFDLIAAANQLHRQIFMKLIVDA